jgi:hypothetical protein
MVWVQVVAMPLCVLTVRCVDAIARNDLSCPWVVATITHLGPHFPR